MLENGGKRLYWDWKHRFRTNCTGRSPDLTLEDEEKKTILLVDMACPNEANRQVKQEVKIKKYEQICFELRERREGYTVKVIPIVTGCLGGGTKNLKRICTKIFKYEIEKELYNDNERNANNCALRK